MESASKSQEKKTTIYKESDKNKRQEFLKKVKKIDKESIIYIDECGVDRELFMPRAPSCSL
jgi:hypothetical protein